MLLNSYLISPRALTYLFLKSYFVFEWSRLCVEDGNVILYEAMFTSSKWMQAIYKISINVALSALKELKSSSKEIKWPCLASV